MYRRIHIAHIVPNKSMHGLLGYQEVIETLCYGFRELGVEVDSSVNRIARDAQNIVLGAQVMSLTDLEQLPRDSIIYNFEQLRGLNNDQIRQELHYCARFFTIWDYSEANLDAWTQLGAKRLKHAPVCYAPTLTRINRRIPQDIDVFMYGLSGVKRANVFHQLSQSGVSVLFASGLYGKARDSLLERTKLVVNVNLYDQSRILEIVRLSYLFSNRIAVITLDEIGTYYEEGVSEMVTQSDSKTLVGDVRRFLDNDSEREKQSEIAFDNFRKRDIRELLSRLFFT